MNSVNKEPIPGPLHNPKYQMILRYIQINRIDNREIQLFRLPLLNLNMKEENVQFFYIKRNYRILA